MQHWPDQARAVAIDVLRHAANVRSRRASRTPNERAAVLAALLGHRRNQLRPAARWTLGGTVQRCVDQASKTWASVGNGWTVKR